jgi:hypothetical protein
LLYKQNLSAKKNQMARQEMSKMLNDRMSHIDTTTRSSVGEINTFLHQVSYDVETFITRYKIEHTTLSERLLKLSEDVQGLVNNVLDN